MSETKNPQPEPPKAQRPAPTSTRDTWCTRNGAHDFCADFDGEDTLGDWDDAVRGTDYSPHDVDETTASERSAPNAFRVHGADLKLAANESHDASRWNGAFLTKKLPTTTKTKATVAFDLFVDGGEDAIDVLEVSGRTADRHIAFTIWMHVSRESTWLSTALGETPKLPAIEFGRWVHVAIDVDDNGGSGGVTHLSFDGVDAGTTKFEGALADASDTELYLGVSRSAPSGAYDVRYDNVVFDYR